MLPHPTADVVHAILVTTGFLVPGVILCKLLNSTEQKAAQYASKQL
jgi:hypothetical protein